MIVSFDGVRLKVPGLSGKYDYTGKKEDDGTGLKYFGARFYDPEVGRFINQDPLRSGENWYTYCEDNPLRFVDNLGLDSEDYADDEYDWVEVGSQSKTQQKGDKTTITATKAYQIYSKSRVDEKGKPMLGATIIITTRTTITKSNAGLTTTHSTSYASV